MVFELFFLQVRVYKFISYVCVTDHPDFPPLFSSPLRLRRFSRIFLAFACVPSPIQHSFPSFCDVLTSPSAHIAFWILTTNNPAYLWAGPECPSVPLSPYRDLAGESSSRSFPLHVYAAFYRISTPFWPHRNLNCPFHGPTTYYIAASSIFPPHKLKSERTPSSLLPKLNL
ncbi:hypothetical protein GALMADRAFT_1085522 [Galerina marginata CBS 339.88]|uniref:Uncharacterized protein n=1 Tax=Galerina marginata (strain CBS 339.88) TaxID=685588 RepID=A0A067S983_GALM3|nr:hypothetical protein GALMADRAFT_1085522 [Galerina marginata CBS 339.88]